MASRGVTDVVHKVVAVGSRDVRKAQGFIDDILAGDKAIKAGTYEDVYADKVSCSNLWNGMEFEKLACGKQHVDAVYVGQYDYAFFAFCPASLYNWQ